MQLLDKDISMQLLDKAICLNAFSSLHSMLCYSADEGNARAAALIRIP